MKAGADNVVLKFEEQCLDDSQAMTDDGWGDDGYEYDIVTDSPTFEPTAWNYDNWSGAWGAWKEPISEHNGKRRTTGKRKGQSIPYTANVFSLHPDSLNIVIVVLPFRSPERLELGFRSPVNSSEMLCIESSSL